MRSIVLCGGYAKRLLPISEFIPKPLLFVNGKPIIDHIVDRIVEIGIRDITISTNKRFEKHFIYYSKTRNDANFNVIVEPTFDEEGKFGAIKGMKYALDRLEDDDYLIIAGDNYFTFNLKNIKEFFIKNKETTIGLYDIKDLNEARRFGVVSIDSEGFVREFEEKPENPKSTLVSTAIYFFPSEIKEWIDEFISKTGKADQPGRLIKYLVENKRVYGVVLDGEWYDIGTIDTYRELFYRTL